MVSEFRSSICTVLCLNVEDIPAFLRNLNPIAGSCMEIDYSKEPPFSWGGQVVRELRLGVAVSIN